ncbi:3-dehydroquinate synthase [Candidatus Acetothermia bacterium]|nr:3-dehydroquinate synthase [Candidatus Acetothermia bacterium]
MQTVQVNLGERSYPIYIKPSLLDQLGTLYKKYRLGKRAALITDDQVAPLYSDGALDSMRAAGVHTSLITVPAGEEQKSLQTVDLLFTKMMEAQLDRSSTVIALGGGVIGDLSGFVAATYLRGVAFVQVPTTLMAQVDSSVGGKTSVNHRLGKNLIGAFYQPKFVLIDPLLLKTLPSREFWSGLSEVIKYGLIRDTRLFEQLEQTLSYDRLIKDTDALSQIIARCCQIKAEITSQDEKESDLRRILNFGHTIGHALEAVSHFELKHGEAIAWGMRAAAWLSLKNGSLNETEFGRVSAMLEKLSKPSIHQYNPNEIFEYIHRDKKVRDEKIHFVLLKRLGEAIVCSEVSESELREALDYLKTISASAA